MPGSLRLAGGRPQLTAGIRAGSYAHECINLANEGQTNGDAAPRQFSWSCISFRR